MPLHVFFWHNIVDTFAASVTNLQVAGGPVCKAAEGGAQGLQGLGGQGQFQLVLCFWVWTQAAQVILTAPCFLDIGDPQWGHRGWTRAGRQEVSALSSEPPWIHWVTTQASPFSCMALFTPLCYNLFFFFNIYSFLRERETEHELGRDKQRGDTESKADSRLWTVNTELDAGLKLRSFEITIWAKVRGSTDWVTRRP